MEKRKDKRFKEWNKVVLKSGGRNGDGPGPDINAYTYDLSIKGAKIYSEQSFPVGSVVRIQIELARSQQALRLDAEVRWIEWNKQEKVYEMGVEFLHELSQTIMALIKHLYGEPTALPASMY